MISSFLELGAWFSVSKWNFINWVVAWAGIIFWEWVTVQNWLWVLVLFRENFGSTLIVNFLQNWYFGIKFEEESVTFFSWAETAYQSLLVYHGSGTIFWSRNASYFYFLTEQKQPVSMSIVAVNHFSQAELKSQLDICTRITSLGCCK